jgi:hypothetical protein
MIGRGGHGRANNVIALISLVESLTPDLKNILSSFIFFYECSTIYHDMYIKVQV